MPYKELVDLPDSVRDHLPHHAQEIYRAAFNSAWNEYGQDDVAWAAVKTQYEKEEPSGEWRTKREV